jgi:hypothetical protein
MLAILLVVCLAGELPNIQREWLCGSSITYNGYAPLYLLPYFVANMTGPDTYLDSEYLWYAGSNCYIVELSSCEENGSLHSPYTCGYTCETDPELPQYWRDFHWICNDDLSCNGMIIEHEYINPDPQPVVQISYRCFDIIQTLYSADFSGNGKLELRDFAVFQNRTDY